MIVAGLYSVKDLNLSVEDHIKSSNLHTSYTPLSFFDERTLIENQKFQVPFVYSISTYLVLLGSHLTLASTLIIKKKREVP